MSCIQLFSKAVQINKGDEKVVLKCVSFSCEHKKFLKIIKGFLFSAKKAYHNETS